MTMDLDLTGSNGQRPEDLKRDYERDAKRLDALKRLSDNPDFKFLILEELFVNEAAASLKVLESELAYNNERLKNMSESKLLAIGAIQRWMNNVIASGVAAPQGLADLDELINETEEG